MSQAESGIEGGALDGWQLDRPLAYGTELDPAWCEDETASTWHANAAVAAGIALGADSIALIRHVSRAAMVDGRLLAREDEAVHVVAAFTGISEETLLITALAVAVALACSTLADPRRGGAM